MDVHQSLTTQLVIKKRPDGWRDHFTIARAGHDCNLPRTAITTEPLDPRTYQTPFGGLHVRCKHCHATWGIGRRGIGKPREWHQLADADAIKMQPDHVVVFNAAAAWAWPNPKTLNWTGPERPLLPNGLAWWQLDFVELRAVEGDVCASTNTFIVGPPIQAETTETRLVCLLRSSHDGKHEAITNDGLPIEWG